MSVFVVQQQMRFDRDKKVMVPRFPSISKAESFGRLVYLLSPSAHPFDPELVIGDLHKSLSGFSDEDYLLLVGNPCLIGMATSVAAHYNKGRVTFLQWSGRNDEYTTIMTKMF